MNIRPQFDTQEHAQLHFGDCDFNDLRRTKRLVNIASNFLARPAASLPQIGEDWKGAKAIYRFLDCPEATLQSVTQAHRDLTRPTQGRFLIAADTTHIDFGKQRKLPDAGPVGPGKSKGFLLHSGLMIDADSGQLAGLAGQTAHVRQNDQKGKPEAAQRDDDWRESEMWIELMQEIGSPQEQAQYIHLCDSAADNFEVFCTAAQLDCDFVIRAGRLHRNVLPVNSEKPAKMPLSQALEGAEKLGTTQITIAQGNGREERKADLRIRCCEIDVPLPSHPSPRMKEYGQPIRMWAIVVEEFSAPKGVEPLRWVLLTTLPIDSLETALEVIGWYEDRWLVEEWHKALKTGCAIECRQLQSVDRLLPLAGISSVIAVLLLNMKFAAKTAPDQPAREIVPPLWLKLLAAKKKIKSTHVSNYEFWRGLAKLGGFLGRKSDGEPGWQLIWRGWKELHRLAEGAMLINNCG